MDHLPVQAPLGVNCHVDEKGAEYEQIGTVVNGVLDEGGLDFARDGEAA